ncbi:V-type proton ATPase 16 kDa proteolipid subunit [Pyrus x bretschneideri]|nr:V-type proton ATPase 16 kDa proteolipid subunit [Pyrus x bretschneideri]
MRNYRVLLSEAEIETPVNAQRDLRGEERRGEEKTNPSKPRSDQRISVRKSRRMSSSTFSGDETAPFFGFLGAAAALVFSCMGAAYGTAKSGVGVASMGVMRPELVMKSIVPVVMAGVLGIYGLIIAVIISTGINPKAKSYYLFDGYAHLSSGLACGLAGLSAGMAIGIVGDAGVRANAQQPKLFVGMILILIFAEALALYGLIVGIILSSRSGQSRAD